MMIQQQDFGTIGDLLAQHVPIHADASRPDENDEDSREDEEDQWEDHFDRSLGGFFFCDLSSLDSH